MRRSEYESMEKTPTDTPVGGIASKLLGGKGGIGGADSTVEIEKCGVGVKRRGSVDVSGIVL
jgi:hypothetical protein